MARVRPNRPEGAPAQGAPGHEIAEEDDEELEEEGAEPATTAAPQPPAEVKPPPKLRVVTGGRVVINGSPNILRPGKTIDPRYYDVAQLREQGIRFEELPA